MLSLNVELYLESVLMGQPCLQSLDIVTGLRPCWAATESSMRILTLPVGHSKGAI